MITSILTDLAPIEAKAYGLTDLDLAVYEREFNAWLDELEEAAAAYRELVAAYTPKWS